MKVLVIEVPDHQLARLWNGLVSGHVVAKNTEFSLDAVRGVNIDFVNGWTVCLREGAFSAQIIDTADIPRWVHPNG